MGHDWILDVLADLRDYAKRNGLVRTAAVAEDALGIARDELDLGPGTGGTGGDESPPPRH